MFETSQSKSKIFNNPESKNHMNNISDHSMSEA